jgi:hypothetical protein
MITCVPVRFELCVQLFKDETCLKLCVSNSSAFLRLTARRRFEVRLKPFFTEDLQDQQLPSDRLHSSPY